MREHDLGKEKARRMTPGFSGEWHQELLLGRLGGLRFGSGRLVLLVDLIAGGALLTDAVLLVIDSTGGNQASRPNQAAHWSWMGPVRPNVDRVRNPRM